MTGRIPAIGYAAAPSCANLAIKRGRCYKKKDCWGQPMPVRALLKVVRPSCLQGLDAEGMCILHFTLFIEQECAEMRRETALGHNAHERLSEFMEKIQDRGDTLVQVATSGFGMSDEIKARILSTLLTLMNCRENMDRAAMRQSSLRRFAG